MAKTAEEDSSGDGDNGGDDTSTTDFSWGWEAWALGSLCCLIILLPFIIFILIAVWVYKDAEKRGMSGILWFLIVWLLGIIGLIIYLIVRKSHPIGGSPPPGAAPPPGYPPQQPPPGYPPQQPPPQQPPY
jgi:hypothetical protein